MGWGGYGGYGWAPYVPVAKKKAMATKLAARVAKKQKRSPAPVIVQGRKAAKTFWGQAWCDHLEAFSDYANRLPRGMTYLRNGSVADLVIKPGRIEAIVAGSEPYKIKITIASLPKSAWQKIKNDCAASIDSILDLLAGRFSKGVMQRLTRKKDGLFPSPGEIKMGCSCPDHSACCKHLAAVMYGIGSRLDEQPELLFLLRGVDHEELVSQAVAEGNLERELDGGSANSLGGEDLEALFGIELDSSAEAANGKPKSRRATPRKTAAAKKSRPAGRGKQRGAAAGKASATSKTSARSITTVAGKTATRRKTTAATKPATASKVATRRSAAGASQRTTAAAKKAAPRKKATLSKAK